MINQQEWDSQHTEIVTVQNKLTPPKLSIKDPQKQTIQNHPIFGPSVANPILPPGVHRQHPQLKTGLQFRYISERNKLNRTTFPEVRNQQWTTRKQKNISEQNILQEQKEFEQKLEQYHEYSQLLANRQLVYQRINNKNYNHTGNSYPIYFCSFFFNTRKDSVKSRKTTVFQYLMRLCKDIKPKIIKNNNIKFSSQFQSGNLLRAYKCFKQPMITYDLFMQNDINTKGSTQWYYFSAVVEHRLKAKFRLINFYKPTSLYMNGMKILVSQNNGEWKRLGTSIRYYKYSISDQKSTYAMEFIYQLDKPGVQYRFSYGYPYTYTQLQNYIHNIVQNPLYRKIVQKTVLCQTFLGNNLYMLNITDKSVSKTIQKPIIYIIARQHPGQTPASYVTEGLLQFLLSNRLQMIQLREKFIIKLIPMCNIDGVINGNYRSNFSGNDINRQWWTPSRKIHPQVYYIKQQILSNKKNAAFFLDIHAHSRKMNSFFYGSSSANLENRIYPFICSKLNKNISFEDCSFNNDPSKRTTARVVLENQASIKKSLTFEVSFYGYQCLQKKVRSHFNKQDLRGLGQSLALGLFYSQIGTKRVDLTKKQTNINLNQLRNNSVSCKLGNQKQKKPKKQQIQQRIQKNSRKMLEKWKKQAEKIRNKDQIFSEGSSLDPEHFQLDQQQTQEIQTFSQHIKHMSQKKTNLKKQYCEQEEDDNQINCTGVLVFKSKRGKNKKKQDLSLDALPNLDDNTPKNKISDLKLKSQYRNFPIQSNLKSNKLVKKLQSQLQIHKASQSRYGSMVTDNKAFSKQRERQNTIKGIRFKSIQAPQKKEPNNYRYNIFEMKKALKYFIENKNQNSTDYEVSKNNLWASTTGRSIVFNDNKKYSDAKKRYKKIGRQD